VYNNLRSNDTLTVTAARSAGAGTLLGTTNVAAVGGIATYTDLAHPLVTNITIRFSSGALVAATYPNSWAGIDPTADILTSDPIEALAISYLNIYINFGFEERIRYLARLIDEFALTGFIMHSNRSCKPYSVGMYGLRGEVSKRTGKPGVVIEADQNDPRVFSEAQVETRLDAFLESMTPLP
jgi:hypothetical protein